MCQTRTCVNHSDTNLGFVLCSESIDEEKKEEEFDMGRVMAFLYTQMRGKGRTIDIMMESQRANEKHCDK